MASDKRVENYLNRIWNNWQFGSGPCQDCPNRDNAGCYTPYYGDGILDAEIAFVAETPGGGRDIQNEDQLDWELPGSFSAERGGASKPGWITDGNRIPDEFFDSVDAWFEGTGQYDRGIYFTNAKKCQDIDGKDMEWKNIKAKLHCREYLKPEMNAVDPEVIVVFGEKATDTTFDLYDVDEYIEAFNDVALSVYRDNEPYVIPSYHWSNLFRNLRHIDGIDNHDAYWESLADTIESTLDS
ncbi:uracil-DNA glycosylase family protein [Halococcoides cellulosivorans]|uniref:Uracil-DNA glycosylase-like domain-containing protein n=1 Tax=Halococcoides cellulosivorans TaxID=1679096 RepID=A0A2R4X3T9_9EURY|nr:uracil-DNA glycosylase family protein [Halococcoides cellulosivorans]AWB28458.1 hypothetical protein HARCEL1_12480 [Halococcoides cellulosivorans]